MDKVLEYLPLLPAVVGGASIIAAALAPLTKTDKDDKIAKGLKWVYDKMAFLGMHMPSVKAAAERTAKPPVGVRPSVPTRDHRVK